MRMRTKLVLGLFLVLPAWLVAAWGWERVNRFHYEFGVTIVYQGRSITLSRTVACIPPRVHRRYLGTGRSQEAITARLDDGSGLVVVIPALCDDEAWPLSDRYVPLIFWTPDADHPDVFEAYLSEGLLRSGEARLTLTGVTARQSSAATLPTNVADFVVYAGDVVSGDSFRSHDTTGIEYVALIAQVVTPEQWKQQPSIAGYMAGIMTSGNLSVTAGFPFVGFEATAPMIANWLYLRGGTPDPFMRQSGRSGLDHGVALRWTDGAFRPEAREGVALFYRADKVPPTNMMVSDRNTPGIVTIIPFQGAPGSPHWPMVLGAARCMAGDSLYCYDRGTGEIAQMQLLNVFFFGARD